MSDKVTEHSTGLSRRQFVITLGAAASVVPLGLWLQRPAVGASAYTDTIAALKTGVVAETTAQRRYALFGRLAAPA